MGSRKHLVYIRQGLAIYKFAATSPESDCRKCLQSVDLARE